MNLLGDGTVLSSTTQDLERIRRIDAIEKTTLLNLSVLSNTDLEKYTLSVTNSKNDYSEDIKSLPMFSQAKSFSVLGICYLFMLAMMLVSVLFSIYGVNRKKLLKYLR